jgi:MoxR-like ATPase
VLATQNPIEYEGTYSLPEAQLDRFLMRIRLGYPETSDEIEILNRQQFKHPVEDLEPVISTEQILEAQEQIRSIFVSPAVKEYIVSIVNRTRSHESIYLGSSPRGSLTLYRAGQARAALWGRDYVLPDDVKILAPYVLPHRMIVSPGARLRDLKTEDVIEDVLDQQPIPERAVAMPQS